MSFGGALAVALPLADPQFWLVTALVALVALLAGRRVRNALRAESERPCANCPKVVEKRPELVALGGSRRSPGGPT